MCASSAPPITGPATTSVDATIVVGQDVDQILREPPDERRLPEDAVRIQIHAAVVAVAVVEVPVEHEHFELLQRCRAPAGAVRRGCVSSVLGLGHSSGRRSPGSRRRPGRRRSSRRRRPSASSRRTACSSTSNAAPRRRTVTLASGASTVRSAGPPSVSVPPGRPSTRAGLADSSSTSRGRPDHAGVHQPIEAQRHGGLEADDAERRAIELERLLVGVMRRVVGGDDVDRPVAQAFDHRERDRLPRAAAGSS